MKHLCIWGSVALLIVIVSGCAGQQFKVGNAWDPDEARFFDDGVDLVTDLSSISGEWATSHGKDLENRVYSADLIAVGEVILVQTTTDANGEDYKRIDVSVIEALYGKTPSKTVSLKSARSAPGHELVIRHEKHLFKEDSHGVSDRFILFIRWFHSETIDKKKRIDHHFHLSPASQDILPAVDKLVKVRKKEETPKLSEKRSTW